MATLNDWVRLALFMVLMYALLIGVVVGMDMLLSTPVEAAISGMPGLSTMQMAGVRGALCE